MAVGRHLVVACALALCHVSTAFNMAGCFPAQFGTVSGRVSNVLRQRGGSSFRMSSGVSTEDCACTIVGAGRIGQTLEGFGKSGGFSDTIIRRGDKIPADGEGPIYVCTRNDALDAVIDECPPSRRSDLVFYGQNGYIEDFLRSKNVFDDSTKVLVYMAVAKLGEKPTDGITDLNPEGLTAATGKWSGQVAARLRSGDMTCNVLDEDEFRASMMEKLMWISAFMLLGVHHGGITVGDVESKHRTDFDKMVTEMATCLKEARGIALKDGTVERLCAYARSVAHFPTALKEFEWRNKFWLDITREREAAGKPDLTPFHTELLLKARDDGHVQFE
eukprot:CAMPEP_0202831702 /NCGR_PEP_ID=MMETSP1389-20130828/17009_1 /ASSEMBLY_ACC=CAM_ASM_000865 /TAXON_ID=302021 /ORGANISM="Rhodomonas sp., Strain CCMP768" /LENGTH=331 /DNA_ID=CAMNT_0049505463 /DNA_START=14 /DNA_END=1009 /DNA_ORIENTATION=-